MAAFRSLFNRPVAAPSHVSDTSGGGLQRDDPGPPPPVARESAFVTTQSLCTFSGMTGAITLTNSVLHHANLNFTNSNLVLAALAGALLFYLSESDPQRVAAPAEPLPARVVVAGINTLQLYSAVVGINAMAPALTGAG